MGGDGVQSSEQYYPHLPMQPNTEGGNLGGSRQSRGAMQWQLI